MYTLTNLDNVVRTFKTDEEFIKIVNEIQEENEHLFILETPEQCAKYINDYCDNLMLSFVRNPKYSSNGFFAPLKLKPPQFYQLVLKPIDNVMEFVYGKNAKLMTLEERLPNNGACPECGKNVWYLLPNTGAAVREGGKPYIECENCGNVTHL